MGHLEKYQVAGWHDSEQPYAQSFASQTDLSKCSVILSPFTSLGRLPTHRCRVSRTIPLPPAIPIPQAALASRCLSLPLLTLSS